jgi:iron complex outermembrane recepter protein
LTVRRRYQLPQCAAARIAGCLDYTPYMINLANEPKPHAPERTFNAGVHYAMPVGQSASLTPRVNYSYVGSQWKTLFDAPVTDYLRSYWL